MKVGWIKSSRYKVEAIYHTLQKWYWEKVDVQGSKNNQKCQECKRQIIRFMQTREYYIIDNKGKKICQKVDAAPASDRPGNKNE